MNSSFHHHKIFIFSDRLILYCLFLICGWLVGWLSDSVNSREVHVCPSSEHGDRCQRTLIYTQMDAFLFLLCWHLIEDSVLCIQASISHCGPTCRATQNWREYKCNKRYRVMICTHFRVPMCSAGTQVLIRFQWSRMMFRHQNTPLPSQQLFRFHLRCTNKDNYTAIIIGCKRVPTLGSPCSVLAHRISFIPKGLG